MCSGVSNVSMASSHNVFRMSAVWVGVEIARGKLMSLGIRSMVCRDSECFVVSVWKADCRKSECFVVAGCRGFSHEFPSRLYFC